MEFATLLTAFAALLTSFITMFTVKEMRKQRVVSHLPIIKVIGCYVKADIDQNNHWTWKEESLKVRNFGKGVALDLKVTWQIPIDDIIILLKKYDPYNIKDISVKNGFLILDTSAHNIKIQSEKFFPAITENTESNNQLTIPSYLTTLFGQYINEALINRPKVSKDKSINLADFPVANINISYTDINDNDNEHEKSFSLSTSISTIYETSDNKNGNASVVFEVQENFL